MRAIVPKKLTSMILLSTGSSVSMTVPLELSPALLTRMSTRPNSCRAAFIFPARDEGWERSRERILGEKCGGLEGFKERWINRYEVAGLLL